MTSLPLTKTLGKFHLISPLFFQDGKIVSDQGARGEGRKKVRQGKEGKEGTEEKPPRAFRDLDPCSP
ncbi:hypothetical protein MFRU_008g03380 [Monilinia fructicola]|nr:hypothetical protein MFRU_008g03380 [Monilinia fructicola]